MPRPRVDGSCAFWKKLVLVRNTFPSVPHPLNQAAASGGCSRDRGVWGSCQKQGWRCLFFSRVDRGDVLKPLPILFKLNVLFASQGRKGPKGQTSVATEGRGMGMVLLPRAGRHDPASGLSQPGEGRVISAPRTRAVELEAPRCAEWSGKQRS